MPFLSHQSMTLYGTPFYAIVPINCNALVTRPIYDTLRYSFLCYCIIVMKCFFCPTNLWASTVLLLCYCSNKLQCLFCPTNQWPSTVLLFMLLHHCIAMHYFTQPIYDPLLYSFLCYCTYPNLWHSTVLGHAEKGESAPNDETPDQSMTLYGTWPKIKVRLTTNPQIESDLKQVLRYSQNYDKSLTIVRLITSPQ